MAHNYSFGKEERLRSRRIIKELFDYDTSFPLYPFRVYYMPTEKGQNYPSITAISVSKRAHPGAVDRNRIKRLVREAWRHNKQTLYDELESGGKQIALMLVYTAGEIHDLRFINKKCGEVITKLLLNLRG